MPGPRAALAAGCCCWIAAALLSTDHGVASWRRRLQGAPPAGAATRKNSQATRGPGHSCPGAALFTPNLLSLVIPGVFCDRLRVKTVLPISKCSAISLGCYSDCLGLPVLPPNDASAFSLDNLPCFLHFK